MSIPAHWVSVDPGETTGYAVWSGNSQLCVGQSDLWDFVWATAAALLPERRDLTHRDPELTARLTGWEMLVMEDWALYPDKALALSWDPQETVRGIGCLEFIATALERNLVKQPAKIKVAAKAATAEDLFRRPLHPNRHANDATMHGVYWLASQGKGVAA